MMITTTDKKTGKWKQFGQFSYFKGPETIELKRARKLMLLEGQLYPDIKLHPEDLFSEISRKGLNSDLRIFKGRYCGCIIDKDKAEITIFNDQLGLGDVYYMHSRKEIMIATDFTQILKERLWGEKNLDKIACAEMVLYEHSLLDRTFLKEVKILPYATIKTIRKGGATKTKSFWRYGHAEDNDFDIKKALIKLDSLMHKAMKRIKSMNNEAMSIGISGGLDSRIVARYALTENIPLRAFVISHKGSDAFKIAKQIAKSLKIDLKLIAVRKQAWNRIEEHVAKKPLLNILYSPYASVTEDLPKTRSILTGFNGDNIFGSHIKEGELTEGDPVAHIRGRYELKSKSVRISDNLMSAVKKDLQHYNGSKKTVAWKTCEAFNFENRQLHFIKNSAFFDYYGKYKTFSPFADIDVVEFALKIPVEHLQDSKFYNLFIQTLHPDLAKIRPERKPYNLHDGSRLKQIKSSILALKWKVYNKTGIKIPLYPAISFQGMLDWEMLSRDFLSSYDYSRTRIAGIDVTGSINMRSLSEIRTRFHLITEMEFIRRHLEK
ncbi:hypothetical protein JW711_05695 [Candidatus Woesearchaeota archaeon]|nr:hypothetical protein [Candidatus Woesearchaeota archaeon]